MSIKLIDLLKEAEEEQKPSSDDKKGGPIDPKAEQELKNLLKMDYSLFVKELGDNIKDPKFIDAIKSLSNQHPLNFRTADPMVGELLPTQNEIDVDKSLKFSLTNPQSAEQSLKGGLIAVAGKRIITGGGGAFIIDGHHRWSQVCSLNPEAKIAAIDLSDIKDPIKALKATQLGIAADLGKVPSATVKEGNNLLKISKDALISYVTKTITPEVVEVFKKAGKGDSPETIGEFIWTNIDKMQKDNQPISGAPKRDIMPQTDDAKDWQDLAPNTNNIKEIKRLQKLAGIK
jgi:hypothetical protein